MEIAFNHDIEISAAKEKEIQEYIYRIYSTKVSSDILADLLKPENHMFVPNMNNIDFLKYCLDNALYDVQSMFKYFLKDIYHNDDEAINRILFYINFNFVSWAQFGNSFYDILDKIEGIILQYCNNIGDKQITTENFEKFLLNSGFTESNIEDIYNGFVSYFNKTDPGLILFEYSDGVLALKKYKYIKITNRHNGKKFYSSVIEFSSANKSIKDCTFNKCTLDIDETVEDTLVFVNCNFNDCVIRYNTPCIFIGCNINGNYINDKKLKTNEFIEIDLKNLTGYNE